MCICIATVSYTHLNELPHNNIAAMDCIMEQLFVKHQQSRKYQAYDYSGSFDYTSNKMMLGVLSKEMFDYYNDGSMDKTQAEILLNQYLNSQTSGQELNNARIVDDLFRHDTHQLGVIEERIGSRISFINRQLQEFMTAKYLSLIHIYANQKYHLRNFIFDFIMIVVLFYTPFYYLVYMNDIYALQLLFLE